jgi:outer membrane protein assembly factor BamD
MYFHHNIRAALCLVVLLGLTAQFSSCTLFSNKEENRTARELAEDGMEAFRDKDYLEAIEAFEKLRDWYPFSQYALLAELKLGDAHYHRQEYEEAIFAYQEFENLHPKNEAVPYVVYQTGLCYFDRIQTVDRDQTMAIESVRVFERLVSRYPDSPYAKKAQDHIRTCRKNMAEHELYVGNFYLKTKHYKGAQERFISVIRDYPDLGVHYKAIQNLERCRNEMDKLEIDAE